MGAVGGVAEGAGDVPGLAELDGDGDPEGEGEALGLGEDDDDGLAEGDDVAPAECAAVSCLAPAACPLPPDGEGLDDGLADEVFALAELDGLAADEGEDVGVGVGVAEGVGTDDAETDLGTPAPA